MATGRVPTTANSPLTAKGDLFTYSTAPARLAVGNNGESLVADSSTATGLKWAAPSSGSSQVAGKNAILNGDFLINQRNFTSNTADASYNFDRWTQQNFGGTFTLTPQTFTPGAAPIATYEGRKYLQAITASQSAAGHLAVVTQRIEDVTRYAGTTVTVSFFAKADTGTPKIGVELFQSFGTGGSPSAGVSAPGGTVTLSTSWARYSVSIAVPSISGKTLGTNANTSYLEFNLWQSAGSTYNARSSTTGIQNFTASYWGVQVEYGSVATYFTTATGTLQGELAACQRYYYRQAPSSIYGQFGTGNPETTGVLNIQVPLPVNMRINPSAIDTSATSTFFYITGGTAGNTPTSIGLNANQTTTNIALVQFNKSASFTVGAMYQITSNNTASAFIGVSAEL
jgi:hypothetical protein